eukprot:5799040-Prymnesium_polylepis.2
MVPSLWAACPARRARFDSNRHLTTLAGDVNINAPRHRGLPVQSNTTLPRRRANTRNLLIYHVRCPTRCPRVPPPLSHQPLADAPRTALAGERAEVPFAAVLALPRAQNARRSGALPPELVASEADCVRDPARRHPDLRSHLQPHQEGVRAALASFEQSLALAPLAACPSKVPRRPSP